MLFFSICPVLSQVQAGKDFLPKLTITHYKTQCLVFKKSLYLVRETTINMRLNSLRTNSHCNLEIVYKLNMSRIWFSGLFIQNIFTILLTYTNLFTNVLVFCSCTKYINQIQISFENVFCHFTELSAMIAKKKLTHWQWFVLQNIS